jgi:hypothetical protein
MWVTSAVLAEDDTGSIQTSWVQVDGIAGYHQYIGVGMAPGNERID